MSKKCKSQPLPCLHLSLRLHRLFLTVLLPFCLLFFKLWHSLKHVELLRIKISLAFPWNTVLRNIDATGKPTCLLSLSRQPSIATGFPGVESFNVKHMSRWRTKLVFVRAHSWRDIYELFREVDNRQTVHYEKLDHRIMQFKSFHWLCHHGVWVISKTFLHNKSCWKKQNCAWGAKGEKSSKYLLSTTMGDKSVETSGRKIRFPTS